MTGSRASEIRVGISGWTYPPWRGVFYPRGLAQSRELEFASRELNSIEINGSFYALQNPVSYQRWFESTPHGFVFAIKGGRYITHMRKLLDVGKPLANFFASGVLALEHKTGPFLWQLPPALRYDRKRLERFLSMLPRDSQEAAKLARGHDSWLRGRSLTRVISNRPFRHALEVRNRSFENEEFVRLMKAMEVAIVVADTAGKWPLIEERTADFMYARLHGEKELYVSGYDEASLERWAGKIRRWTRGDQSAYVYFDNDVKVRAPFDALSLLQKLTNFEPAVPLKAA